MIGIIDSGFGGLSVARELIEANNSVSFVYLGDNKNVPYGTKTKEEITNLALQSIQYLVDTYEISTLIIACNTIVAASFEVIEENFPQLTTENIVAHGALGALQTLSDHVAVIATEMTCKSNIYKKTIQNMDDAIVVQEIPASPWVKMVETFTVDEEQMKETLKKIHSETDTIILGCTHFPFLYKELRRNVADSVQIVDPAYSCAQGVSSDVDGVSERVYLTTGNAATFEQFLRENQIDANKEVKTIII